MTARAVETSEGVPHLNILIFTRKPKAVPAFNLDACTVSVVEVTKSSDGGAVVPGNTDVIICYPISHSLIGSVKRQADALGIPVAMTKPGQSGLARRLLEYHHIDIRPYLVGHEDVASIPAEEVPVRIPMAQIRAAVAEAVPLFIEQAVTQAVDGFTDLFLEELGLLEKRLAEVEQRLGIIVDEVAGRRERHQAATLAGIRNAGRLPLSISFDVSKKIILALRGGFVSWRALERETGIARYFIQRHVQAVEPLLFQEVMERPYPGINKSASPAVIQGAISALKDGQKTLRQLARETGIPRTTLQRRIQKVEPTMFKRWAQ